MKQFEKQHNESCNIIVDCGNLSCKECKKIQAAVWREALEWVKREASSLDRRGEVEDIINKELES